MPRGKRVEWTEFEQDTIYSAVVDVLKREPRLTLIKAMQASQIAIQDERRRRNIYAIANVPAPLRNRLINAGLLAKDWDKMGRRRRETTPAGPDLRDARIEELEQECVRLADELREARVRVAQLEQQPGPVELIQNFLADTAALAMQKMRAVPGGAPGKFTPPEALRPHHDPTVKTGADTRPPILLLMGLKREELAPFERKFNGRAYFRYWADGKLNTLAEIVRRAEFTIIRSDPPLPSGAIDTIKGLTDKYQSVVSAPRMEEEITNYLARRARGQ